MKKAFFGLIVMIVFFTGCGGNSTTRESEAEAERIQQLEEQRRQEEQQEMIKSYAFEVIKSEQIIGQRSEGILPQIKRTPIGQLTAATGWRLFDSGQWISRKNRIVKTDSKTLIDYAEYGNGKDNFISYNLYDMKYGENEYVILIKHSNAGHTADEGRGDWIKWTKRNYWVMNKTESDALKSLRDKEPAMINLKVLVEGEVRFDRGIGDIEKDIIDEASRKRYREEYKNLDLIIFTDKEQDKVLFYFDKSYYYSSYNGTLSYMCLHDGVNELVKNYYETTYSNFSRLFPLP